MLMLLSKEALSELSVSVNGNRTAANRKAFIDYLVEKKIKVDNLHRTHAEAILKGLDQACLGSRDELVERIRQLIKVNETALDPVPLPAPVPVPMPAPVAVYPADNHIVLAEHLEKLTLDQLKNICRKHALPIGGIRADVLKRVVDSNKASYNDFLDTDLKSVLRSMGLSDEGSNETLVNRIINRKRPADDAGKLNKRQKNE